MTGDMTPEEQWPSVELAYEFVRPSYDWIQRRLDVVETRLQTLQTLLISLTLAVPAFGQVVMRRHDFTSPWFVVAIVFFLLSMATGIVGRTWGVITLADPSKLYKLVGYSEWEFKKIVLFWAGDHFEMNRSLANWKGKVTDLMLGLIAAEVVCLAVWIRSGM